MLRVPYNPGLVNIPGMGPVATSAAEKGHFWAEFKKLTLYRVVRSWFDHKKKFKMSLGECVTDDAKSVLF